MVQKNVINMIKYKKLRFKYKVEKIWLKYKIYSNQQWLGEFNQTLKGGWRN